MNLDSIIGSRTSPSGGSAAQFLKILDPKKIKTKNKPKKNFHAIPDEFPENPLNV